MGGFYGSVQIRSEDRDRVVTALDALAEQLRFNCLVSPVTSGWIGVYPDNGGQSHEIGRAIAAEVGGIAWHVLVHDDSVLAYWLWRDGELIDVYRSCPGYFSEEDRAAQESLTGNPELLAATVGGEADKLQALLDRNNSAVFEVERLEKLGKLVGVKNLVTSYEYLKTGETEGITGAKKFTELPRTARKKKAAEKRAKREQIKSLQKQGVLLHSEKISANIAFHACATPDGFPVLQSTGSGDQTVRVLRYRSPKLNPEVLSWPIVGYVTSIAGGAPAQRVAICLGTRVEIRDVESGQIQCEIPAADWTANVNANRDVDILATIGRPGLKIVGSSDGEVRMSEKFSEQLTVAIHPSGQWIVSGNKGLNITRVEQPSNWRNIPVSIHKVRPDYGRVLKDYLSDFQSTHEELKKQYPHISSFEPLPHLSSVGFSRDGTWLWCGAAMGVWVYRWDDILQSSETAFAQWWYPTTPWIDLKDEQNGVCSIVEAMDGQSIYFGTGQGHLNQLELKTGSVRNLLSLPEGQAVSLLASVDGISLASIVRVGSRKHEDDSSTFWQIWNSQALERLAP